MKNILRIIAITIAGLFLIYVSILSLTATEKLDKKLNVATLVAIPAQTVSKEPEVDINNLPFQDNPDIYQYDAPTSVVTMYVTVRVGNSTDNSNYTWKQVNDFTKWFYTNNKNVVVGRSEAIVQVGDEKGPIPGELGYGAVVSNATIQIRGASTSLLAQKSYKIELRSQAGKWRGQTTIDLNKHVFDPSRLRQKLSFDLMKQIPNMVSLRTQFVHLYVKDETVSPAKTSFEDYGLFTQVEQPNKRYLRAHLLDPNAQLYKATFFEFNRYPDQLRLVTDPSYNLDSFSSILEVKGNQDHSKLIQMLDDLNNYDIPIEQTFEKYFNEDNYFTWLAFNILIGNVDTQSQNFLLYSPQNGIKWYFMPWDYDGTFFRVSQVNLGYFPYQPWEYGIANYWGSRLHRRVLSVDKYRHMLDNKINELMKFLTPERIKGMVDSYRAITDVYTSRMPDLYYDSFSTTLKNQDIASIPGEIKLNYDLYLESLQTSMPFYLGTPEVKGNQLVFNWDESTDFGGQNITYHFMLSNDWEFKNVLADTTLKNEITTSIDMLKPGEYFWQVLATNDKGKIAYPFDLYWDAESKPHYSMKYFYVTQDGKVLEK
jgi:spore coat protein H